MIIPIFEQGTTIDEMSSLDNAITDSNYTKEAISDKKKIVKKFIFGGAFICLLTAPIGTEANVQPKHEIISHEALSYIVEKTERDLFEIKKDIELIAEVNSFDLDSLIDGDEIREEMEIISDYMKKAKDVYAYCNERFTL